MSRCRTLVLIGLVNSGKSTLVNALTGRGAMPTSNLVCTAMPVTAVDLPGRDDFPAGAFIRDDAVTVYGPEEAVAALEARNREGGGEFYLRMDLSPLNRGRFPLAVVDTPGVNDGMDGTYRLLAAALLRRAAGPAVLFVSHVHTCGTQDEERCLRALAPAMRERGLDRWFAAVNGWNFTDPQEDREQRERYESKLLRMAEKCGLPEPRVFFAAALPAALCAQALEGRPLSKSERITLDSYLEHCGLAEEDGKRPRRYDEQTLRAAARQAGVPSLAQALYAHFTSEERNEAPDENI